MKFNVKNNNPEIENIKYTETKSIFKPLDAP